MIAVVAALALQKPLQLTVLEETGLGIKGNHTPDFEKGGISGPFRFWRRPLRSPQGLIGLYGISGDLRKAETTTAEVVDFALARYYRQFGWKQRPPILKWSKPRQMSGYTLRVGTAQIEPQPGVPTTGKSWLAERRQGNLISIWLCMASPDRQEIADRAKKTLAVYRKTGGSWILKEK